MVFLMKKLTILKPIVILSIVLATTIASCKFCCELV